MKDEPTTEGSAIAPADVEAGNDTNASVHIAASQTFSGPLPPPSAFREYEEILPGAAERILALAEQNARARREQSAEQMRLAQAALDVDNAQSNRGTLFGFFLSLGLLVVALVLALEGATWPAVAAAVSQLAPIFAVLVPRARRQRD